MAPGIIVLGTSCSGRELVDVPGDPPHHVRAHALDVGEARAITPGPEDAILVDGDGGVVREELERVAVVLGVAPVPLGDVEVDDPETLIHRLHGDADGRQGGPLAADRIVDEGRELGLLELPVDQDGLAGSEDVAVDPVRAGTAFVDQDLEPPGPRRDHEVLVVHEEDGALVGAEELSGGVQDDGEGAAKVQGGGDGTAGLGEERDVPELIREGGRDDALVDQGLGEPPEPPLLLPEVGHEGHGDAQEAQADQRERAAELAEHVSRGEGEEEDPAGDGEEDEEGQSEDLGAPPLDVLEARLRCSGDPGGAQCFADVGLLVAHLSSFRCPSPWTYRPRGVEV